jgi:hypothetical protein
MPVIPSSFFDEKDKYGWCPVILEQLLDIQLMVSIAVRAHPSTLDWLRDHFAVSAIFLESLINVREGATSKLGNACFLRRNESGRILGIGMSPQLGNQKLIIIRWLLFIL